MSNLIDVASVPVIDVWGESVRARRIEGERVTLALVELAPNSIVPGHRHDNEQLGMVITGSSDLHDRGRGARAGAGRDVADPVGHAASGQRRPRWSGRHRCLLADP